MSKENKKSPIIVSACLAGVSCRYDCQAKSDDSIKQMVQNGEAIPLCPEQLGGLSTPRDPAEIQGNKVISNKGNDVTANYEMGAQEGLKLTQLCGAKSAILKSKSPMCGVGEIYDGTFSGNLVEGDGIFTRLLKKHGIKVKTEND